MSISSHDAPAAAVAVVVARCEVAGLHEQLWAAVSDGDLIDVVAEVAGLRAELASIEAAVLVELDVREVPRKRLQWSGTAAWLAHSAGITRGQAKATVRHAHDLLGDRSATCAGLRAGVVSPGQAAVICRGVRELPGERGLRDRAEAVLLDEATRLDAGDLARVAARVVDVVDPGGVDRRAEADLAREDRAAHAERFFSVSEDGAGGVRVKGRGSLEDGAVLRAALLPLTAPAPAGPTAAPMAGEQIGAEQIGPEQIGAEQTRCGSGAGEAAVSGTGALDAVEQCGEVRDVRDHGARMWDALVALAQHGLDTELPPTDHATVPRVVVTVALSDLLGGLGLDVGSAMTDDGMVLPAVVARRFACDAEVVPVVLGTGSEVLDVGRAYRTATPAIWRALIARDTCCAFPSCARPPLMCHAHHLTHWAEGGETALANLVLLCGEHYRTVHHTPWRVRLSPDDGCPEFSPPPRGRAGVRGGGPIDPATDPTWIRHRQRGDPMLQ